MTTTEKSTDKIFDLKFPTRLEAVNEREPINTVWPRSAHTETKEHFPVSHWSDRKLSVTAEVFSSPQISHVASFPQLTGTAKHQPQATYLTNKASA